LRHHRRHGHVQAGVIDAQQGAADFMGQGAVAAGFGLRRLRVGVRKYHRSQSKRAHYKREHCKVSIPMTHDFSPVTINRCFCNVVFMLQYNNYKLVLQSDKVGNAELIVQDSEQCEVKCQEIK
jgi:hypothetical protein